MSINSIIDQTIEYWEAGIRCGHVEPNCPLCQHFKRECGKCIIGNRCHDTPLIPYLSGFHDEAHANEALAYLRSLRRENDQ